MSNKVKKEQPRYSVQRQYERSFKRSYAKMIDSMMKEVIHTITTDKKDD